MTSRTEGLKIIALSPLLSVVAARSAAQDDPDASIEYGQNAMNAEAAQLGARDQIVKGYVGQQSRLPHHATALYTLTNFLIDVFPEGSDFGETRAKEETRENFEAFTESARRAKAATK